MWTVSEWIIVTQNNEYGVGGDRCTPTSSLSRSEQWNTIKVDRMPCFCSKRVAALYLPHSLSLPLFSRPPRIRFFVSFDCLSGMIDMSNTVRNTHTHTHSVVMFGSSFLVFIILFNANETGKFNNIFDHKVRRERRRCLIEIVLSAPKCTFILWLQLKDNARESFRSMSHCDYLNFRFTQFINLIDFTDAFWIENHFWSDRYNFLLQQKTKNEKKNVFSLLASSPKYFLSVSSVSYECFYFQSVFHRFNSGHVRPSFRSRSECRNDVTVSYMVMSEDLDFRRRRVAVSHFSSFRFGAALYALHTPYSCIYLTLCCVVVRHLNGISFNISMKCLRAAAHFHLLHIQCSHMRNLIKQLEASRLHLSQLDAYVAHQRCKSCAKWKNRRKKSATRDLRTFATSKNRNKIIVRCPLNCSCTLSLSLHSE